MSEKLHYYLISFNFKDEYRNQTGFASARIGWEENYVNEVRIEEAKRSVCPSTNAVPLSINYLGHMTREAYRGVSSATPNSENGHD